MKKIDLHSEQKINHPHKVPDDYFQQLSADILERKSNLKKSPVILSKGIQYALAGAMMLIIAFSIVFYVNRSDNPEALLAEVSNEEIMMYLDNYELSDDEILQSFGDDAELEFEWYEEGDALEGIELDDSTMDDLLYEMDFDENTQEI